MGQRFSRRGRACVDVGGAVVRLVAEGPCDREWVAETGRMLGMVLDSPLRLVRWALMLVVYGTAECSPDALLAIREAAMHAGTGNGRVATAWVFGTEVEGRRIMPDVLRGVYAGIMPLQVFDTEVAARAWLHAELEAAGVADE